MVGAEGPERTLAKLGIQFLVRGWLSANNIVFRPRSRGDRCSVVDTGYVAHSAQTVALIQAALSGRTLDTIINTHLHSDHCGGNAALRAQWPRCDIAVPDGYRDAVIPWDESRLSYQYTGQRCTPFTPTRFIPHGCEIRLGDLVWQVHGTGGHDPDAVVLFEPRNRILISGDALWADRLAIVFSALSGSEGFVQTHATLDLIEGLGPSLVLPGHGEAFTDVASALAQSRRRLDAFVLNPERHVQHAARALVMFRMLEIRRSCIEDLKAWVLQTPIFREALCVRSTEDAASTASTIISRLIADGALAHIGRDVILA